MFRILPAFVPAKPTRWIIKTVQAVVRGELAFSNRLHLAENDLDHFRRLPPSAGVILASNHADETDPLVCLELSRRSQRTFISMCNREAFDEIYGLAGLLLQRLGHFSVRRGAHDSEAKQYAIKTVQRGGDILVIFPEGEIFYLNEVVQPFHSGAVEICFQAIVENRKTDPAWTAFILPMVIKYHYNKNIENELAQRIKKMEARLLLKPISASLQERLVTIQRTLLEREKRLHSVQTDLKEQLDLTQQIMLTEKSILSGIEEKHQNMHVAETTPIIDQAWQLEAEIREDLAKQSNNRIELEKDLASLNEVAQLSSWSPKYYLANKSLDRLAEGVLKQERELYKIKRPRQLANRKVIVKLADPIDMGDHVTDYLRDPHTVRHLLTQQIHEQIQTLLNSVTVDLEKL
jgi:1-acyl-sn-glycerol-3-phosphate acyltransferase